MGLICTTSAEIILRNIIGGAEGAYPYTGRINCLPRWNILRQFKGKLFFSLDLPNAKIRIKRERFSRSSN